MKLDAKALNRLIEGLARQAIRETLNPLREDEKDRQKELEKELKGLRATKKKDSKKSADEDLEEAEDEETSDKSAAETSTPADEKPKVVSKKLATGKAEPEAPEAIIPDPSDINDVTFDQVITLMNMMRSGKSARDPRTKGSLKDYFKGLNSGEKQALFVLLSGLAQILAGGVEGDAAPDPAEVGIKIKAKASTRDTLAPGPGAPTKKTDSGKPTPASLGSVEPVPIVVGEASNRSRERSVLESLRNNLRGKR
jgi:hypothetical protein